MRLFKKMTVVGLDKLPDGGHQGGFIVASNHQSDWDPFFLAVFLPMYEFHFFAKHSLWEKPGIIGWLTKRVLSAAGQIPLNRADSDDAKKTLDQAGASLKHAFWRVVYGIFPESTKSPDGRLYKGYVGVAKIAYATGLPVQCIARKGNKILIGDIHYFEQVDDPTYQQLRGKTNEIMASLQKLTAQEYVDEYARRHHA